MTAPPMLSRAEAEQFLFREALYLDRQDWDAWLALYDEDCEFWLPAWRDEGTPTSDPDSELSLIYYRGRRNLEDRVWRVRSGTSVASFPLARTSHAITNVLVEELAEDIFQLLANFTVHRFDPRSKAIDIFFGHYEYTLSYIDLIWKISRKKIYLLNDIIPTVLDFYSI